MLGRALSLRFQLGQDIPMVNKKKASKKVNSEPTTQPCCGAPKNSHYSTCKKGGKK